MIQHFHTSPCAHHDKCPPYSHHLFNHNHQFALFKFFLMFIHFWETERDRVWAGEGHRERETQTAKQDPDSEPSAQSLTQGSNSWTVKIMTWADVWPSTDWATQVPQFALFNKESVSWFVSLSFSFFSFACFVSQVPYMSEIIWYLSFSGLFCLALY